MNNYKHICTFCEYYTNNIKDFNKHKLTSKHKHKANVSQCEYRCECGKTYKYDSGYYRHKKTCKKQTTSDIDKLTNIVLDMVYQNSELTKQIIELSANQKTINNIDNSKTFNLQLYLNNECRNALNMQEFVESIHLQLSDLENTGQVGYVEGISRIFINNLGKIQRCERPIHCSDYKRETLYIKNNDEWIKEDNDKTNIKDAINRIALKNIRQIKQWQEKHPEYSLSESRLNDTYFKIICNSMSGSTEEEQSENVNKIIKNIAREVIIIK